MSQPPQGQGPNVAIEVAKLIRHNKALKQRKGLFQNNQTDFFRYKRFLRALNSKEYRDKSRKQPNVYPILTNDENPEELDDNKAKQMFINMISNQLILPVIKPHSNELKQHNLKPNKDFPHLLPTDKAILQPDQYYIWNYNPKSIWDYITVFGIIFTILALVCYPLWPLKMRRGTYYISLGALWLIIVFFIIAIIRLIIAMLSYPFTRGEKSVGLFWLFPNFFEDCGILDSFKPLYGFGDLETYTYQKKMKRLKKKQQRKEKEAADAAAKNATPEPIEKIEELKEDGDNVAKTSGVSTKPVLEDVIDDQV